MYRFIKKTHFILSILITGEYRNYFMSAHWAWEMFYHEKEMGRTRNIIELKRKYLLKFFFYFKIIFITKYVHARSIVILIQINTPIFVPSLPLQDMIFELIFNYFARSILHAVPLRMPSTALYSKMAGKTFIVTHKLQHARYS